MSKIKIGFIGQGYVGKNYADDFVARGYNVIRYAKEKPYDKNKDLIRDCDVVFIAVPTPSTPNGFDDKVLRKVMKLVGVGKIAVIKSTIIPGTTKSIQNENPAITVLHSPEFLSEVTAAYDAANPNRNIIGMPKKTEKHRKTANAVMKILPKTPYNLICTSVEAEMIKYSRNIHGYFEVIFTNMLYDLAKKVGADWKVVKKAMIADPFIPNRYLDPVHKSGRGAGGHCFIKDFAAFKEVYKKMIADSKGIAVLESMEKKNIELLRSSGKDVEILENVYNINKSK